MALLAERIPMVELSAEQKGVVQLALAVSIILKRAGKETLQTRARGSKREICTNSTISGSLLDCDGESTTVDQCEGGRKTALNNSVAAPDLTFRVHQIRDAARSGENVDLINIERMVCVMLLEALMTRSRKGHFSEVFGVLMDIASSSGALHLSVTKAFLHCLTEFSEELKEGSSDVNMVYTQENGTYYFDCLETLLLKTKDMGGFAKGHCNDVWKVLSMAMLMLASSPLEQSRVWLIYHVLMSNE